MDNEKLVIALGVLAVLAVIAVVFGRAFITGNAIGTTNATVAAAVSIQMNTNNVNFGSISQGSSNNTFGNNPAPFVIENTGNVKANITIGATDIFTAAPNPSSNYQFITNVSAEGTCYNATQSPSVWTNIPATGSPSLAVSNLDFPALCDTVNINVKITVPTDEAAGAKGSTVTFTASQA